MKNKANRLAGLLLLAALLCSMPRQSSGQSDVAIAPGVGFTELINLGLTFRVADQARVGFSVGWWPPSTEGWFGWGHLFAITGDFYTHFAGSSEYSTLRPWFARIGINYVRDADYSYFLPIYLRVGRELNIDESSGISIDAGAGYNLIYKSEGTAAVLPVFGICFFHRF